MRKVKFTPEVEEEVVAMYLAGHSTVEIAKRYNTSPTYVYQRLKKRGVQIRSREESLELRRKKVRLLRERAAVIRGQQREE